MYPPGVLVACHEVSEPGTACPGAKLLLGEIPMTWSFEWDNSPWNNEIFMGKSWEIDRKVCYGKPPFIYNG